MRKLFIALALTTITFCTSLFAQTSVNIGTVPSVTGCNFTIYDDGGANGTYGPSHNYTLTIYPTANQGRVSIHIVTLDIHQYDTLYVYDGATTSGTPIAMLNNSTFSTTLNTLTLMASQTNTTGALTLRFKSSYFNTIFGNNHGDGFELQTSCIPACVPFQIVTDSSRCSHLPALNPSDGYHYLDLCPGETVQYAVRGIYSNNASTDYTQSDATTHFSWHLGSAVSFGGTGLDSITHTFATGNGGEVIITATDTLGCPAQLPVTFRVRVSANPIVSAGIPPFCTGQSIIPTIGDSMSHNIVLQPVSYVQPASLSVHDTVFLPDGESCPPYGLYYRSNVTFTEFAPGATLTSANDILYVRIKMEHSAIEDLQIHIFCPNGSSSTILPQPNYNVLEGDYYYYGMFRVNLGSAYRPDGGSCNAALNPMGDPWNYIWSDNNSLGYGYAPGNGVLYSPSNFHSHYNSHWDDSNQYYFGDSQHSYSVDSSNVAQMTQIYHPYQSFNSLVGCPLNGNWYIQVQDMLQEDNGYIVEWELALNPQLMPSLWSYEIGIDSTFLSGNGVVDGSSIFMETAGTHPITFTAIDNFGCSYDTSFNVTVQAMPEVSLGADRQICPGGSVVLSSPNTDNGCAYLWNTGASTPQITATQPGTYSLTASVVSNGDVLCQSSDTVEVQQLSTSETLLEGEVCDGYSYTEYGFNITPEAIANHDFYTETRTLTNLYGCDSIVTLNLTVLPRYNETILQYACEQFVWEGDTLTESGDYTRTYLSQYGCDSVVTLNLAIGYPEETEVWETVCGQYQWNGETFTESGVYKRYFTSLHDCDSAVTLHLTVIDTFLRTFVSNPDFCTTLETELSVEGNFDDYLWSTGEVGTHIFVTQSGLYTLTASNVACQQVERFNVPFCPLNILLPNAITPSKSDGLNDAIVLSEYEKVQIGDFNITIYDRWGGLVFLSDDKNFSWDGSKDGKLAVNAVYNYIIHCTDRKGKAYVFKGSITVL